MGRVKGRSSRSRRKRKVSTGEKWTPSEDAKLRALFPSYDCLQAELPHRSYYALRNRARRLNLVRRRHVWTNVEVSRLRDAFVNQVPDRDLEGMFPGLRLGQIKAKAGHIKAPHRKGRRVDFGVPALDAIREKAKAMGHSYVELDKRARTGKFFQKSNRKPILKHISRAAKLLGGEVMIHWEDEEF